MDNKRMLIILFAIFALGLVLRLAFAYLPYFYEPDDFYHYSVVLQALANNGILPLIVSHSGYPATPLTEPSGLYLVPIILSEVFGVQHSLVIMQYTPLLFYIGEFILALLFIRLIWKDNRFVLLAMFFSFLAIGLISRTMVASYRGDGFVSLFILAGLYCIIKALQNPIAFYYAIISGLMFALACFIWAGGSVGIAILIFGFIACLYYNYAYEGTIPLLFFILAYASFVAFCFLLGAHSIFASSLYPLVIGIGMFVILYFFNMGHILAIPLQNRRKAFVMVMVSLCFLCIFLFQNFVTSVFLSNGFSSSSNIIQSTIQELQPPNALTYIASFGTEMFLNPIGYILIIASLLGNSIPIVVLVWVVLLAILLVYLNTFIDKEDPVPMLMFLSYFAVIAYLMLSVIRFTALFAIPFGILTALGIVVLIEYLASHPLLRTIVVLFIGMLILFMPLFTFASIAKSAPYTNPNFDNASLWLHNAPSNSVIVTDWSDGSVVELLSNRTVTADSVGAFNGLQATDYSKFIFSNPRNGSGYLDTLPSNVPLYLFYRYEWQIINVSFMEEGGFRVNQVNLTDNSTVYQLLSTCTSCSVGNYSFTLVYQNNDSRIYSIINVGYYRDPGQP